MNIIIIQLLSVLAFLMAEMIANLAKSEVAENAIPWQKMILLIINAYLLFAL